MGGASASEMEIGLWNSLDTFLGFWYCFRGWEVGWELGWKVPESHTGFWGHSGTVHKEAFDPCCWEKIFFISCLGNWGFNPFRGWPHWRPKWWSVTMPLVSSTLERVLSFSLVSVFYFRSFPCPAEPLQVVWPYQGSGLYSFLPFFCLMFSWLLFLGK